MRKLENHLFLAMSFGYKRNSDHSGRDAEQVTLQARWIQADATARVFLKDNRKDGKSINRFHDFNK